MFKKINIKEIRESLALLVIAAVVGTIVSFVAQLFIISAKNIYDFIFNSYKQKVDNNPSSLAVFEKNLRNSANSIKDSFVKKYVVIFIGAHNV